MLWSGVGGGGWGSEGGSGQESLYCVLGGEVLL